MVMTISYNIVCWNQTHFRIYHKNNEMLPPTYVYLITYKIATDILIFKYRVCLHLWTLKGKIASVPEINISECY